MSTSPQLLFDLAGAREDIENRLKGLMETEDDNYISVRILKSLAGYSFTLQFIDLGTATVVCLADLVWPVGSGNNHVPDEIRELYTKMGFPLLIDSTRNLGFRMHQYWGGDHWMNQVTESLLKGWHEEKAFGRNDDSAYSNSYVRTTQEFSNRNEFWTEDHGNTDGTVLPYPHFHMRETEESLEPEDGEEGEEETHFVDRPHRLIGNVFMPSADSGQQLSILSFLNRPSEVVPPEAGLEFRRFPPHLSVNNPLLETTSSRFSRSSPLFEAQSWMNPIGYGLPTESVQEYFKYVYSMLPFANVTVEGPLLTFSIPRNYLDAYKPETEE